MDSPIALGNAVERLSSNNKRRAFAESLSLDLPNPGC